MNSKRQKEIESLKAKLATLEAEYQKEQQERAILEQAFEALSARLQEAGISFDAFVKCYYKEIRKIVTKIEREAAKERAATPAKSVSKKRVTRKKGAKKRKSRAKAKTTIKIPAGTYGNIPSAPDQVFKVAEKGARPKLLKAYAEEVGLETFLNTCRID